MKKRSKRFKKIKEQSKSNKLTSAKEVIPVLKKNINAKFDESIDVHFKINIKQVKSDFNIRTVINLPNGLGKKIKVAVLCEESKVEEAKNSGADFFNSEILIKEITDGKIKFDKIVSTPAMMAKIGKLGKILGPKGLMPNPKLGTVSNDLKSAVKAIKSGQVELKNDKDGNIGASIGKKSFSDDKLLQNFNSVLESLLKEKPDKIKGDFILSSYITSTMGASYKLKTARN